MTAGIRFTRLLAFALASVLAVACAKEGSKNTASESSPVTAPPKDEPGVKRVTADGKGFTPNAIELKRGEPATLIFTRTTDETCARDIVFPELEINQPLPLDQPVTLEIPTSEARTLTFQCGMGMYKSSVVVQ